jgi:hypothetical protein
MSEYEETYQETGTVFDESPYGTEAPPGRSGSQPPSTSRHKRPDRASPDNIDNIDNIGHINGAGGETGHGRANVARLDEGDNGPALLRDSEDLRKRWESVQVGFVDNPCQAVGEAESLVSSAIDQIVSGFRRQTARLEAEWSRGGDASTDELRVAFQRYREFSIVCCMSEGGAGWGQGDGSQTES